MRWLFLYKLAYIKTLVYMLQSTEYNTKAYVAWYLRVTDFRKVMHRRTLVVTRPVQMLLIAAKLMAAVITATAVTFLIIGQTQALPIIYFIGVAILLAYPVLLSISLILPLLFGELFVIRPRRARAIKAAESVFAHHEGTIIAVTGSYGKTSMKELLNAVLSEGLDVRATPANKNVAISHAAFAQTLTGNEEVLVIEYGEGAPGDVTAFAHLTHPTHAIITGIAPAHLDQYKTLDAAVMDIFSVRDFVPKTQVYINAESKTAAAMAVAQNITYDRHEVLGWKIKHIQTSISGTSFIMKRGTIAMKLHSGLLGAHQVGPLALVAALAFELGMSTESITTAVAKTQPHEHRMQPYLLHGAWIIDDTYNGNIAGIQAGTELLATLEARRKIYVSPGLVDQGAESERVHVEMGAFIANAKPDIVVLMKNSVTSYIERGLREQGFHGELRIEDDPLYFYQNLDQFVAVGDVVLMQNDWTDNYA